MTSRDYWKGRNLSRINLVEEIGMSSINHILPIYEQALNNINKEINNLYIKYADKTGLDVMELTKILTGVDKDNFLVNIQAKMRSLGFNMSDVYDTRYLGRITRLEALKQQVYWEIQAIAPREIEIQERGYKLIIERAYEVTRKDIRDYMVNFEKYNEGDFKSFATLDTSSVYQIMRENWLGGNFYSRTWANNSRLNAKVQEVLPSVVGGGLMIGLSEEKMQLQIREHFDVSRYWATRLIRTETNYFLNQAELKSYEDEGIEYYEYIAILDNRTSKICENLNGQVFKVSEAEVGVNYPPMHPNCRSDTFLIWKEESENRKVWEKQDWLEYINEAEAHEGDNMFQEIYETQMTGLEDEGWKRR